MACVRWLTRRYSGHDGSASRSASRRQLEAESPDEGGHRRTPGVAGEAAGDRPLPRSDLQEAQLQGVRTATRDTTSQEGTTKGRRASEAPREGPAMRQEQLLGRCLRHRTKRRSGGRRPDPAATRGTEQRLPLRPSIGKRSGIASGCRADGRAARTTCASKASPRSASAATGRAGPASRSGATTRSASPAARTADGTPTISRTDAQSQIADASIRFLETVGS